jgi:hypothetical protein
LDAYLDRRVVGKLTATIASIVQTRSALTLAELGSAIGGPEHTEAGTQRLHRALHHQGWQSEVIEEVLWDQAEQSRKQMEQRGETPLCLWDSSVLEKPESVTLEGLGAVRSSRVRRLARSRRVLALPVSHPEYRGPLWLVVVRHGKGREPWYLLTNEPVETAEQAWEITFSYVRRWKIEESFRFQKTELLIESLRLHDWEPRRKMLLVVTLAYGSLLSLLDPCLLLACCWLFVGWCPRADWRLWTAKVPLYRLRWALSRLWQTHPPRFSGCHPYRPLSHITWPVCSLPWWTTLWHQCGFLF